MSEPSNVESTGFKTELQKTADQFENLMTPTEEVEEQQEEQVEEEQGFPSDAYTASGQPLASLKRSHPWSDDEDEQPPAKAPRDCPRKRVEPS